VCGEDGCTGRKKKDDWLVALYFLMLRLYVVVNVLGVFGNRETGWIQRKGPEVKKK